MGYDGTGHDENVAHYLGVPASSASTGRAINEENHEEFRAVASLLEEKRTINGHEVSTTIKLVRRRRQEAEIAKNQAEVILKDPNGKETRFRRVNAANGSVMIPGEWITLPRNDSKEERNEPIVPDDNEIKASAATQRRSQLELVA